MPKCWQLYLDDEIVKKFLLLLVISVFPNYYYE